MTAPMDFDVMLLVSALVVLSLVYMLVKFTWKQPLPTLPAMSRMWTCAAPCRSI